MKKLAAALLPFALAIAGCDTMYDEPYGPGGYPPAPYPEPYPPQPYPTPYPAPVGSDYRASGTEPFWDLIIGRDMVFNDRGTGLTIAEPTPPVVNGVAGPIYRGRRLEVNIVRQQCNDGMSDRRYPDTVQVYADGRLYRGCGGLTDPLAPVPPAGPGGMVANPLAGSEWRVVAINGVPTPPGGDYTLSFEDDRLSARFGCNSLGAGYAWDGTSVDAGAVMSTRMACQEPAARFEADGLRILEQPMRSHWLSGERITLSNAGGSLDLRRM